MNVLGGADMARLKGAISAAELRQQVIADNIANVDTPGFKRSEVLFEELLAGRLGSQAPKLVARRTHEKHIPFGGSGSVVKPKLVTDDSTSMHNSANNVDIDREMALLAKNQLRYNALIQQLNHEISMLRIGIEGR
ncbi:Flagellar basal-body rod protein flgB [Thermobacillus xylanilyticus]|jgi:flagellar basal-body rod protein FlgB|uniref:Flagellar basal body rod protein FlgB n=1 Tax=Thermobacillus xylanilyticus TaxID=76633 RepID=A0ABM8V007_THEXY|nr:flagellar basal body rod protein FlgB [Thermobacillus xylanilyticus]REJ16655.1 MAG: flagellar basal body rod protein FlgB [Paenibacillaceae bacterium]CAG5077906.1 Flagellar basal-body rod protein flgB [Thermobacillus xylanilyticus]